MSAKIRNGLSYRRREEPGVQTAAETLSYGTGSCRDFANLFVEAARRWGLAARFVSGYHLAPPSAVDFGATHAWPKYICRAPAGRGSIQPLMNWAEQTI